MKIAIDIDEVVFAFIEDYASFIERRGYKKVRFEDIYSLNLLDVFDIDEDSNMKLLNEYNNSEHFDKVVFVEGAKEGVCFLRDNYDICFITARPKSAYKGTRDSIFKEFIILGDRVIFSGDCFGGRKKKDEICKDLGISVIIEDNGENSFTYAENDLKVLLLDKPWNKSVSHENIFRCFSWGDILDKIKEMGDE